MTSEERREYDRTEYHWTRRTEQDEDEELREPCEVCEEIKPDLSMKEHHVSYKDDITILVCESCHLKIHRTDDYSDLQPNMSRQEAKEKDLI